MNSNLPDMSIVIPTYNRVDVLMEALHALQAQSFENFEAIIVDNGPSDDGTHERVVALMENDSRLKYLTLPEKSLVKARNAGCIAAQGEIIILTDDDWELNNTDSLQYIFASFLSDSNLGIMGIVPVYTYAPTEIGTWKRRARRLFGQFGRPGRVNRWGQVTARYYDLSSNRKHQVDHVRGCCLAFRKGVGIEAGLFPSLYSYKGLGYRSETELCIRIARRGYKVILSTELTGIHKSSKRPNGIVPRHSTYERMRFYARNHMLFMLRNFWSPFTAPLFVFLDLWIGNHSQPGIIRIVCDPRYFGKVNLVMLSVGGKWAGCVEYYRKYQDIDLNS